jgi:hypothetical protein
MAPAAKDSKATSKAVSTTTAIQSKVHPSTSAAIPRAGTPTTPKESPANKLILKDPGDSGESVEMQESTNGFFNFGKALRNI